MAVVVVAESNLNHHPHAQLQPRAPLRQDRIAPALGSHPRVRRNWHARLDCLANLHLVSVCTDVRSLIRSLQSVVEQSLWHCLHPCHSIIHWFYLYIFLLWHCALHRHIVHEMLQRMVVMLPLNLLQMCQCEILWTRQQLTVRNLLKFLLL